MPNSPSLDTYKFRVPVSVRANADRGLQLRQMYKRGGTAVGIASARRLSKEGYVPYSFVAKVAQYFPRHQFDRLDDKTSNGWIAWQLWGGWAAWRWANGVVRRYR